jgi:1-acyl-sn-glycerol-3-phosphate acyltransferase
MAPEQYSRWQRSLMRWGVWQIIYRFGVNLQVHGWDNIPADGPVVMMGNHINMFDPVIMVSFYPDRDIVPLAKIEAFEQPIMRFFVRHYGAISISRGEADMSALKTAFDYLKKNYVVMLYAEGHRSKTGLIQGQEGSVYIAAKSGAAVVPVAIWGTNGFPFEWFKDFQLMDVHISFGRPFIFKTEAGKLPRGNFRAMTDEAMYEIAKLLPSEWRGVYSDIPAIAPKHLNFNVTWKPPVQKIPARMVASPAANL